MIEKNNRTVEPSRFTCCGGIKKLLRSKIVKQRKLKIEAAKNFEAYEN